MSDKNLHPDDFRAFMRNAASMVTVMTMKVGENPVGMTIGSFTSASLEPILITLNVHKKAYLHDQLAVDGRIAINVLTERQAALSSHFASPPADMRGQFEGVRFEYYDDEIPTIDKTQGVLICRVEALIPAGDHSLVVAEVQDVLKGKDLPPLLYMKQGYWKIGDSLKD